VISSYAQMLGKQLRSDDATHARLQPVLEKITQQTFRASEIVNGLLNFSRMGSVEFSPVDLNTMVRETVLMLEHQMRSAGVKVETELSDVLPAVLGNRGKLQQVLVNLVLNAKDALQDKTHGLVSISTMSSDGRVQLVVRDDGAGMSKEVLRKIYDPFFTTKSNPSEGQRKGTGLGLAVTYGIIQEHSGTIEVLSNVGEGTVFRLELPAAESARANDRALEEGKVVHV
jgi:two-component system NtrC family sensor kinase